MLKKIKFGIKENIILYLKAIPIYSEKMIILYLDFYFPLKNENN